MPTALYNEEGVEVPPRPAASATVISDAYDQACVVLDTRPDSKVKDNLVQCVLVGELASGATTAIACGCFGGTLPSHLSKLLNETIRQTKIILAKKETEWFEKYKPLCPADIGHNVYVTHLNRNLQVESIDHDLCGVAACGAYEDGEPLFLEFNVKYEDMIPLQ